MASVAADAFACSQACLDVDLKCSARARYLAFDSNEAHATQLRALQACAEFCRTIAQALLMTSGGANALRNECADFCAQFAEEWEHTPGLNACVLACRRCADACHAAPELAPA